MELFNVWSSEGGRMRRGIGMMEMRSRRDGILHMFVGMGLDKRVIGVVLGYSIQGLRTLMVRAFPLAIRRRGSVGYLREWPERLPGIFVEMVWAILDATVVTIFSTMAHI